MSLVMEAAMRAWERGLSSIPDKKVCSSHIDDYAIRRYIKQNGDKEQCDYCGKCKLVVALDDLMEFLTDAMLHFYTDPANFMSYVSAEGGYLGEYDGPWEMLGNLGLEIDEDELRDDIFNSLDHSSAWADEQTAKFDFKYEGWLHFSYLVKHQSRLLFIGKEEFRIGDRTAGAKEFLKELSGDIRRQRMLTRIPAGTPIYRCRQHKAKNEVDRAGDICSPKTEHAIYPNRMSPAGVSMFYGAFNPVTAELETLRNDDKGRPYFSRAEFSPNEELLLVYLSKIPYVSSFDQDKWELFDRVEFLHRFLNDFAAPVKHDGLEHIEYVPTQIITEYFRYNFKTGDGRKIDGILYPSSKDRRLNACVLFMDHYQSLDRLDFNTSKLVQKRIGKVK
jgi:hypothetical protein